MVGALPASFTLSEARNVYEAIAGREHDPPTFARDLKTTGLIEPTGDRGPVDLVGLRPWSALRLTCADLVPVGESGCRNAPSARVVIYSAAARAT